MNIKSRPIDFVLILTSFLLIISGLFYLVELSSVKDINEYHPMKEYITNSGVIKISIIQFILSISIIMILVNKYIKKGRIESRILIVSLVFLSLALAIIPWVELWHGSTFYYGEVRDKQGLSFPFLSLVFLVYPFWLFTKEINHLSTKQLRIRIICTLALLFSSAIFYQQIFESWKLWQS